MYQEPEKKKARNKLLTKAIKDLTKSRSDSYILNPNDVITNYVEAIKFLNKVGRLPLTQTEFKEIIKPVRKLCKTFRANTEKKSAYELKVLFLCGPEPLNDIEILLKNGILPHNIHAVESNKQLYSQAIDSMSNYLLNIKMYNGELSEYLKSSNEKFDIVYFDACSSFCTGHPDTLKPILELFVNNRLNPLSVLITNFSEIKDNEDYFAGLLAAYYSPRYMDYPFCKEIKGIDPAVYQSDPHGLKEEILEHIPIFYSDFISRFIIDLGRFLVPTSRALTFKGIRENILNEKEVKETLKGKAFKDSDLSGSNSLEDVIDKLFDWEVNPSGYPLYCFLKYIPELCKSRSFFDSFLQFKVNGRDLRDLLPLASLLNSIIEGHWNLVSGTFLKSIVNIWFDYNPKMFCDTPLPNLLINGHLGVLGMPYHANTKKMIRATYKAKQTKMYMDYFLFDSCTEFYSWLPSIDLTENFFKDIRMQLIARSMIDRLGRFDWHSSSHPFRGSALFSFGEISIANAFEIPGRKVIR